MRQNEHLAFNEKLCRIYNDLHTLQEIRVRNKQRNSEKNQAQRSSERRPTTVSRKKWDSKMNNNTNIHWKQQEKDR